MTRLIFALLCSVFAVSIGAQTSAEYAAFVQQAEKHYQQKEYLASAKAYSQAFQANGWKGLQTDRYNAACSFALSGQVDSAFFQLDRIATKMAYANYNHLVSDTDLNALHADPRWAELTALVKANKDKAEANLNKPLVAILDTIYQEDQKYRMQLGQAEKEHGFKSQQVQDIWQIIHVKDSINLMRVTKLLDQHGWLGADEVGQQGNQTLFLVIQHSDPMTQQRYLPMLREAVKKGKAQAYQLAMLEDRVAIAQGRRQIYGSQLGQDQTTGEYFLHPLEDPDNVDKRREEVGLGPLGEYLQHWDMKWDAEVYKKQLPEIEKKMKKH